MVALAIDDVSAVSTAPGEKTHVAGCTPWRAVFTVVANASTTSTHPGCERVGYDVTEMIGETGLYYARARMYSAGLGRFISRDPLGYVDGSSLYNAYFVPNKLDPSGTIDIPVTNLGVFFETDWASHLASQDPPEDPAVAGYTRFKPNIRVRYRQNGCCCIFNADISFTVEIHIAAVGQQLRRKKSNPFGSFTESGGVMTQELQNNVLVHEKQHLFLMRHLIKQGYSKAISSDLVCCGYESATSESCREKAQDLATRLQDAYYKIENWHAKVLHDEMNRIGPADDGLRTSAETWAATANVFERHQAQASLLSSGIESVGWSCP